MLSVPLEMLAAVSSDILMLDGTAMLPIEAAHAPSHRELVSIVSRTS